MEHDGLSYTVSHRSQIRQGRGRAVPSFVIIVEIKGFAALSTELARAMDEVAVTPERVRASAIEIINTTASQCAKRNTPTHFAHIGGDTWYFQFPALETALRFGWTFLHQCRRLATEKGLFFIKPSLALAIGEPKLLDGRFLDDESIGAYRLADGGKPFHLYIHPNALQAVSNVPWFKLKPSDAATPDPAKASIAAWQTSVSPDAEDEPNIDISLPTLLLDSEVIYSRTASEAIGNIVRQQSTSQNVCAFGGPVPLDIPFYNSYLRETLAALRRDDGPRFSVLSYIPLNEPVASYAWLEVCRRISIRYSDRFAFAAFAIPEGQLRPFSFQIFDQTTVHLGLRSYSMQSGTPTMSSAIMVRNKSIAERFYGEYVENFRKVGAVNDKSQGEIASALQGLTPTAKRESLKNVEELLA
jgi:hypothetical protein